MRKGLEDAGNAPDASDFYYGEMEARRHDKQVGRVDRAVLWVYWAVSGYGLRASRALLTWAILVGGGAVCIYASGYADKVPPLRTAVLTTVESALGFLRPTIPAELDGFGRSVVLILRLLTPILLALAALAFRSRIKR
jgi:hypothetical protein